MDAMQCDAMRCVRAWRGGVVCVAWCGGWSECFVQRMLMHISLVVDVDGVME